jgi:hypothetical protein
LFSELTNWRLFKNQYWQTDPAAPKKHIPCEQGCLLPCKILMPEKIEGAINPAGSYPDGIF